MQSADSGLDQIFLDFQLAVAGRYSIDRELGRGGMGIVFLAREVHLDRLVAIKLLPPAMAEESTLRERFLREARLAAKLSHPNIIPIHAVDEVGGFVFYVMAFVDGETLAQRVRTRGPLSASEGSRILREVAWALAHAHGQGLVHRDVKPDNVLLESGSGRALVADFGIASLRDDIAADGIVGTPEFMSPEQALGQGVDARSDLYSLGATAFFAFSGRLVFEGASSTEVLAKQVTEHAPPMASLGLPIPRRLGAIIDRCLSKDPSNRPKDASTLADQIAVALEQRREVPAALRNFVKRSGRVDGAGTLIGACLLLFGGVGTSMLFGPVAGFSVIALGSTIGPIAYLVDSARRLAAVGFTHSDLDPAFRGEIEIAGEERAGERSRGSTRFDRALLLLSKTSALVGAGSFTTLMVSDFLRISTGPLWAYLGTTFGMGGMLSSVLGIWYVARLQRTRDVDTEFWARVWRGRLGRTLFAIARKLTSARSIGSAMTHRATELALGMAAEQLFDRLPKATREALPQVPALLRQLQVDAQLLRQRHDEIAECLSDAGDAAESDAYLDLRAMRDDAGSRLGDAVSTLETMRLDLLRLHAGSATVEGVTTQLGVAAEVAAELQRLIAARAEVDQLLRFPAQIRATPV